MTARATLAAAVLGWAAAAGAERTGWDDTALRGTAGPALPCTTERAFPELKFRRPVALKSWPARDPAAEPERLLVVELEGAIVTFPHRPDADRATPLLDLPGRFREHTQVYSLAFHPRFPAEPYVYVFYNRVRPKPAANVIARFTVTDFAAPRADPGSEREVLRWPSDGHNGGDLAFGPDGFLYISSGDRSAPGDPDDLGQRVDLIAGGVLRIDVDRTSPGLNYAVPPDNPFPGRPDVRPEYWAYGLRNPWRLAFAPGTAELWVGDNGDDTWESVQLIRRGHNYGWSVFEGSHPFKRQRTLGGPTPHLTPPIIELSHAEAHSVIGGLVYRGRSLPALAGHYLFGDHVAGTLWAFRWDGTAARDFRRIAEPAGQPLGFGEDRAHEVLIARNDGTIHRLVAAAPGPAGPRRPLPARLSATGLFRAIARLEPAAGVIGYEVNAALWSDGAEARRHLAVPAHQVIEYDANRSWRPPDGTALVRTLARPGGPVPVRIETQVMYREAGGWQFFTYAWNSAQTDAELVPAEGAVRPVPGRGGPDWRFAPRSECAVCHSAPAGFALGLSTAQLNRPGGGGRPGQIEAFAALGLLDTPPRPAAELPRLADPRDEAAPLDARARAYLGANCAHCHRESGVGGRAAFQLLPALSLARTGLVNGRPLVPLLGPAARIVVPGAPGQSELYHRLTLAGGGRMPLLGTQRPDEAGIELIRRWIAQLPP